MTLETLILICPFCSLVRRLVTTAALIVKDIFYAVNSKKYFVNPSKIFRTYPCGVMSILAWCCLIWVRYLPAKS